eukprot:518745-Rhodomonas_salina.3
MSNRTGTKLTAHDAHFGVLSHGRLLPLAAACSGAASPCDPSSALGGGSSVDCVCARQRHR